jgi:hypothetical protein
VIGIDGNVSHLSITSLPDTFDPADGHLAATRVELTDAELAAMARLERKARGRGRVLDRSHRVSNTGQYGLSKRRQARAERRAKAGLAERQATVPGGARAANAAGVPKRAYRTDNLSAGYRLGRAHLAKAAADAARARDHRAPPRRRRHRRRARRQPDGRGLRPPRLVPAVGQVSAGHHTRTAHRRDRARVREIRRPAPARVHRPHEEVAECLCGAEVARPSPSASTPARPAA